MGSPYFLPPQGDVIIRRKDESGDSVVLYLDEVTRETSCVKLECDKKFEIENRKPLAVTIYDYYMPSELSFVGESSVAIGGWDANGC